MYFHSTKIITCDNRFVMLAPFGSVLPVCASVPITVSPTLLLHFGEGAGEGSLLNKGLQALGTSVDYLLMLSCLCFL